MPDIIKVILEFLQGQQVSAAFAFLVILAILGVIGYYFSDFLKGALLNAPEYVKKRKNGSAYSSSLEEEWIKSEEGSKYLQEVIVTQIKLNDDRVLDKIYYHIESDLKLKIFEETKQLYERISSMREEYAGNYVPRREIESLIEDLDDAKIQIAKIKGHLNMD